MITQDTNGWSALGDATRRAIFERLLAESLAVSELARDLPVSRPAVSQHLKVLKEAGLVVDRRAGKQRIYRVEPSGLAALRADLDRYWTKTLANFKAVVERRMEGEPMNTQTEHTSLQASIVVQAPVALAFKVFTEDFGSFKPPEHNLLKVAIAETIFERKVGGFIYDRGVDGSVCRWATVLAYEPPKRVVLSWNISAQWQLVDDPQKASEWEARFVAETPQRTRVEIEHRKLDRHGEGWQGVREALAGDQGWPLYLQRYAARMAKER